MKDKELNIAEILKDCPDGMRLYATTVGECILKGVADKNEIFPIRVQSCADTCPYTFTAYGKLYDIAEAECVLFPSKDNRDWSTFKAPKKKHEFRPFDKVLFRNHGYVWSAGFFSYKSTELGGNAVSYDIGGFNWDECIPYEGNEHLLGTCDSPDEKGGKE